ncbi:hypothetical protein B0H17DRAFT_1252140 [Mycena rosella]|uniref:Uncharacterized protein n=1 Tax=Mycena rosella TaxID=1033263 RepID=A0AAD7CWI6_MYCRO|nr:hypothetical protein B0H17DRAFT_1252140 [Mycena rosella]
MSGYHLGDSDPPKNVHSQRGISAFLFLTHLTAHQSVRRPRLTVSNKALIRFLANRGVKPSAIRAHPEYGWAVSTIKVYSDQHGMEMDDKKYTTVDFYRVFEEDGSDTMPRTRAARPRAPTPIGDPGPEQEKGSVRVTDDIFLRGFVTNAGLDAECYTILKTAGFTVNKLHFFATELAAGRIPLAEFENFIAKHLPGMTVVDHFFSPPLSRGWPLFKVGPCSRLTASMLSEIFLATIYKY